MEELKSCPACGSNQLRLFMSCIDYTVSKEAFNIDVCESCGLQFTNPRPDATDIGYYYQSSEYVSHTDERAPGLINAIYRRVRTYTLAQKRKLIESLLPVGSLLDIGCGTGAFAGNMQRAGWQVIAVEPDEQAAAKASLTHDLKVYNEEWLHTCTEKFDVVTMWHVLEHVHTLNQRREELSRLVRKGGLLLVAVPNSKSVDADHYGTHWAARDVPRHLYHFPPEMLRAWIELAGFERVKTLNMHFDPFYIALLSERYRIGKDRMLVGFIKGLWFWLVALLNRDRCSSQIYIFKKR
jgi:2-polyprenyl-3-methyl-5-hydroxy-6-metoxy-1,4-benzoquinol methylase